MFFPKIFQVERRRRRPDNFSTRKNPIPDHKSIMYIESVSEQTWFYSLAPGM